MTIQKIYQFKINVKRLHAKIKDYMQKITCKTKFGEKRIGHPENGGGGRGAGPLRRKDILVYLYTRIHL